MANTLDPEHLAAIEEAAQVLESAAAHNRKQYRTVFAYEQQTRANRLRAVLTACKGERECLTLTK